MITISILLDGNPAGAITNRIMATENGQRFVKDGLNLVTLNGWPEDTADGLTRQISEHTWFADRLCVHVSMCPDGAYITKADTANICKICNKSFGLVHHDITFLDTIEALYSSANHIIVEYDVKIIKACITFIFDSFLSSECLPTTTWATYMQYIPFLKQFINGNSFLPLYERLSIKSKTEKNLGTSHLRWSGLCRDLSQTKLSLWYAPQRTSFFMPKNLRLWSCARRTRSLLVRSIPPSCPLCKWNCKSQSYSPNVHRVFLSNM